MKMIVAFVQPFMTEEVVQALHAVEGLSGASFCDVHGFGAVAGTYRAPPGTRKCRHHERGLG
jgi:nitrogen regulatory protein PII